MRLFVAITLQEEMRKTLLDTMHALKKAGMSGTYVSGQNLHLTLTYIGEVPSAEPVKAILSAIPFAPFRLQLTEPGNFDSTLWVGAKAGQKMKEFNHALRAGLDREGIAYSDQKLVPHITLVRKAGMPWPKDVKIPKSEVMVKKISLMRSSQKDGKTVYTEIFSVS